jgi:LPXTG-site transpeptidase (sortase) family protein
MLQAQDFLDQGRWDIISPTSTPTFVRQFNAVFYLLHKMNIGDSIYIFHEGTRFDYMVYAKQIVDPKDTSFLRYTNPVETIVLQTCWPPGTTSERLLVFAKRIQHE